MTDEEILIEREKEYGNAYESFTSIANLWSEYLDTEVSAEQVAMMMALLKIHRSKTAKDFHYVDSLQDARNYLTLAERIQKVEIS